MLSSIFSWLKGFFPNVSTPPPLQSSPAAIQPPPSPPTSASVVIAPIEKIEVSNLWQHLNLYRQGDDLIFEDINATWFGGNNDPQDNGETASGINTRDNPNIKGCALPMNFVAPCAGSPLGRIPWKHLVFVSTSDKQTSLPVELIDVGPARSTGNALDLTVAAFKIFAPLNVGKIKVTARIPGGARFLY